MSITSLKAYDDLSKPSSKEKLGEKSKTATEPIKLNAEQKIRTIVLEELKAFTLFEFVYRPKHRVQHDYVMGSNLADVKRECLDFCNRHDITYVYVRPACLNLSGRPRGIAGFQKTKEEEDSENAKSI